MMKPAATELNAALLCVALSGAGSAAHSELGAHITIASTYAHRGLELSQSAPVYQAGAEYQADNWFAGIWASSVDFGGYDDRNAEFDYYVGYNRRLSPRLALEATFVHYTFLGDSPRNDDWSELQLSAYLGDRWTATWGIADHWWASDETSRFVEGTYRHPLPAGLLLDATLGYELAERAVGIDYVYAEAGVARRLGEVALRVGYRAVASEARRRFGSFAADAWTASLTWQP